MVFQDVVDMGQALMVIAAFYWVTIKFFAWADKSDDNRDMFNDHKYKPPKNH